MPLVKPHGPAGVLLPRELPAPERSEALRQAAELPAIDLTSREASDLWMFGSGAYTPLDGFMGSQDWRSVIQDLTLADGTFWPIPITLSMAPPPGGHDRVHIGAEVALRYEGRVVGTMRVDEKYAIDREYECREVFGTTDPAHPGVAKVLAQGTLNVGGPVRVLAESPERARYPELCLTPEEARAEFAARGWSRVAALQTRNPLHRSHEYLAKVALEVSDGLFIHQVLGRLKAGDVPAPVRVAAVGELVRRYFVPGTVVLGGYPLEMRYAGPREALLHAVIRQNFGASHLLVGRDHAGVGNFYGPYDAQRVFSALPPGSLEIEALKIDWTFYCRLCDGMASLKTCPHQSRDRVMISGTRLRELLAAGEAVPDHFSRPEVLEVLRTHYRAAPEPAGLD